MSLRARKIIIIMCLTGLGVYLIALSFYGGFTIQLLSVKILDAAFFFNPLVIGAGLRAGLDFHISGILHIYLMLLHIAFVVKGYALYIMSKNIDLEKPWLAFIPFAQDYALGRLADESKFALNARWGLPILRAIHLLTDIILQDPIFVFLGLSLTVIFYPLFRLFYLYTLYIVYNKRGHGNIVYILLSVVFNGIADAIVLFAIKEAPLNYLKLSDALLEDREAFDEKMNKIYGTGRDTGYNSGMSNKDLDRRINNEN